MQMSEEEIIDRFVGRSPSVTRDAIEEHLGHPLPEDFQARSLAMFDEIYERELEPSMGSRRRLTRSPHGPAWPPAATLTAWTTSSSSPGSMTASPAGSSAPPQSRTASPRRISSSTPPSRMGVSPGACAVVEDSQYGVQAARAAGMAAFGYAGSVTPARMLAGPGHDGVR